MGPYVRRPCGRLCLLQVVHQAEKRKLQRELAGLQRRLRETEKRALSLLRNRSQHEEVLARKDRQIQESQNALQELQVTPPLPCPTTLPNTSHSPAAHHTFVNAIPAGLG